MKLSIILVCSLVVLAALLSSCEAGRLGRRGRNRREGRPAVAAARAEKRNNKKMGRTWYGPVESKEECTQEGRPDKVWYRFSKSISTICEEVRILYIMIL